jgi:DNA invertase Pin-like site-specific DNA recombinase
MPTAYSYVRFSSPEQAKGDSLRRQVAASQQYADQHGLTLDTRTYQDLGISAFRGDNSVSGKLGAFISAIDSGQIERGSYLLVESIDRLSRDQILKSLNLFTSILSKGINIVTLRDNKVYTEDSLNNLPDLIYSLMLMSMAHEESAQKGTRVAAAWADKRHKAETEGHKLTHKCPAWLVLNGDEFSIVPEQAELVRRIFQMSIDGHGILLLPSN